MSGCLCVWVSGCMCVWVSGCLGVCVSGCMCVWVSGCLGVWVYAGALDVSEEVVAAVGIPHVPQIWEEIHKVHHRKSPLTVHSKTHTVYI